MVLVGSCPTNNTALGDFDISLPLGAATLSTTTNAMLFVGKETGSYDWEQ